MSGMLRDPLVLPEDLLILPISELPNEVRERLGAESEEFALTRPLAREPSKLIDASAAELLEHDGTVGPREAVGPEGEHAGRGQLVEHRAVESLAHALDRDTRREHRRDAVAQCHLVARMIGQCRVPRHCLAPDRRTLRPAS